MKVASFEAIVRALNEVEVRFIVVGGIAVISHGYNRMTEDVDLVIQLVEEQVVKTFAALSTIGYLPRVPVLPEQFADATVRKSWIEEKGMKVLNFHSDLHRETPIDIFVTEPFSFETEYEHAQAHEVGPGLATRVLRMPTLISLKKEAGRPHDLVDIDELEKIHRLDGT